MVTTSRAITTVEAFEAFAAQPDHADRLYKYIDGEIIEVVSNDASSALASRLDILVGGYVLLHDLGYTTVTDGGYRIGKHDVIPDVAFVSKEKRAKPAGEAYSTVIPDLVVEVKSATDSKRGMRLKAEHYLAHGVSLV